MLFTIRFSTIVLEGDEVLKKQHTLTALPFLTAQSYKRFDDWSMEPYQPSNDKPSGKSFDHRRVDRGAQRAVKAATARPAHSIHHAAATGDMAAAINAGAR